jgi:hypothetical protein
MRESRLLRAQREGVENRSPVNDNYFLSDNNKFTSSALHQRATRIHAPEARCRYVGVLTAASSREKKD